MAIEFWLIQDKEKFQLPVPPNEFAINGGNDNQTVNVYKTGDLALWGASKLQTISIQSFFPDTKSGMIYQCSYGNPWDSVKLIKKMKDSGKPIRLLITETDINMEMLIDAFEYGIGNGPDVNFSLTLTEYRKINIPKLSNDNNLTIAPSTPNKPIPTPAQPNTNGSTKTYTIQSGDTLWGISKKFYNDGSKWTSIWEVNKPMRSGNPNIIYQGEVIKIP